MAVPKGKLSRSRTRKRRSRWQARVPELVPIVVDGKRQLVPKRLERYFRHGA